MRERNKRENSPERMAALTRAAAEAKAERRKKWLAQLGVTEDQWQATRAIFQSAYDRCNNPNNAAYKNYGGRGIEYRFNSGAAGAEWAIRVLGKRPRGHTIDRIDNDDHYRAGNLRWADRKTQDENKRAYRRTPTGERIRRLQEAGSPYHYESLRGFIHAGMTDQEILDKVPYARSNL